MGQITQEWTKEKLWKTAFKKFQVIWSAGACLNVVQIPCWSNLKKPLNDLLNQVFGFSSAV